MKLRVNYRYVRGNTYPVRNELRRLGGEWDKAAQAWRVPGNKYEEALAIVAADPQKN